MSEKQSINTLPWSDTVDQYDVSIIVPTYNRAEYIQECLDSLLAQTLPAKEIIVIDDGSEDHTPEILRGYGNRIRYIRKENGGKSSAVNLALSQARGNLIWLFDDDDVAFPDAIERRIEAIKSRPDVGFVYTSYYWGRDNHNKKIVQGKLNNAPQYNKDIFFSELLKSCFLSLSSALVRVEAYRHIGEFDDTLVTSEDYDIIIRLAKDFTSTYSPHPSFIARQHLGDRGAKEHRTPGQERTNVFRKYDRQVGLKLRNALELSDYLSPRVKTITTTRNKRKALLYRMIVMASKACMTEMFEDLQAALATLEPSEELNNTETSLITSAICSGYAYAASQTDWPAFERQVTNMHKSTAGKQATVALAQGFFKLAKSYPGSPAERARKLIISIIIWLRLYT